ncbi:MAG: hypothetical protein ACREHE_06495 [Rhizomicrobium sp.]
MHHEWRSGDRLRFIWADKTALIVVAAMILVLGVLELVFLVIAGIRGACHLYDCIGPWSIQNGAIAALALWLFLRAIDWAAGGSTRTLLMRRTRSGMRRGPEFEAPAPPGSLHA